MLDSVLFTYGLSKIPMSEASVISQLSPIMVGILATFILKEKYEFVNLLTAIICICGAILIAKPSFLFGEDVTQSVDHLDRILGVCSVVGAGFTNAIIQIMIKDLVSKTNTAVIVVYFTFMAAIISSVSLISAGNVEVPEHPSHYIYLFLAWFLSVVIHLSRNKAYTYIRASKVALTVYFSIVSSYCYDIFFLGYKADFLSILVSLLICSCMFIMMYHNLKKES